MFPVLNNLLLVFVFAIASFGASSLMLTGGIQNEDVGRRKLVTENPGKLINFLECLGQPSCHYHI